MPPSAAATYMPVSEVQHMTLSPYQYPWEHPTSMKLMVPKLYPTGDEPTVASMVAVRWGSYRKQRRTSCFHSSVKHPTIYFKSTRSITRWSFSIERIRNRRAAGRDLGRLLAKAYITFGCCSLLSLPVPVLCCKRLRVAPIYWWGI